MFGSRVLADGRKADKGSASHWIAERAVALWRTCLAIAALVALCVLIGTLLSQSHRDVALSSLTAASNVARTLSQDEARTIEVLDLSLQGVRDSLLDPEVTALTPRLQRLVLFDRAATATDIDALFVLDDQGAITIDSRDVVPRVKRFGSSDFFRAHVHDNDRGLFISRPMLSPFDGEWSIALSRRLNRPDGSFEGVVVGIIKLAYFKRLFDRIDAGPRDVVSLVDLNGTVIMRTPYFEGDIGRVVNIDKLMSNLKNAPSGSYDAVSRLDHVHRFNHYEQVGTLPLVQVIGFSVDDLYRPWKQKAAIVIFITILFCSAILGLVFYLQRELAKRIKAEAAFAELAETDKLTGLPNRRKFDEVLEAEWHRSARSGLPVSLLMIDVDHFKAYNDEYGHLGGDAVLSSFGQTLRDSIRATDFAARFGGEEFAVILPDSDAYAAACVAERIRSNTEHAMQPHRGSPRGFVSVSIGTASYLIQNGQTASRMLGAADAALYEAKASGRNRVAFSPDQAMKSAA